MLSLDHFQLQQGLYSSKSTAVHQAVCQEGNPLIIKSLQTEFPSPAQYIRFQQEHDFLQRLNGLDGIVQVISFGKVRNRYSPCCTARMCWPPRCCRPAFVFGIDLSHASSARLNSQSRMGLWCAKRSSRWRKWRKQLFDLTVLSNW